MPSLSRSRWSFPILLLAVAIFAVAEWFAIQLWMLDRRMTRELTAKSWREPATIVSEAGGRTTEIAKVYGRDWRASDPLILENVPSHVAEAFLAAEDVRFRRHIGIDPIGILRAAFANLRARAIAQGGSTIPQQIVKQHLLTNDRTWRRKFLEGALAVVLDARMSKDELLELYLNDVYLGHHEGTALLGVDEAARVYFDKRPGDLRADEAAVLAAMVRAPNRDHPQRRPDVVRARRNAILEVMRERDWIDEEQYRDAIRRDVKVRSGNLDTKPYPYYFAALRSELVRELGSDILTTTGLKIVTEMNPAAQRAAEKAVRDGVRSLRSRYRWIRTQSSEDPLQAAVLSVDPATGGVRALVGGADFNRSSFDRTDRMRRQPGSAFKTFAYLAAIASKRATTASLLLDTPLRVDLGGDQVWEPSNYDERFRGRVTLRESFERSLNVPTVRLTQQIGVHRVAGTAEELGFEDVTAVPALPLGVDDVSMRELTAAYTVFPNLGERVEPYLLRRVIDAKGNVLFERQPQRKRVVDAGSAYIMHTLLRGVVRRGTASRLRRYGLGEAAGKTGTTNDYRDAWFVGYTRDVVTTVWVGFDRGAPLRLSSSEAAIPIWAGVMEDVADEGADLEPPDSVTFRRIDPQSGMLWRSGCPGPIDEVFLDGTAPTRYCPRGLIGDLVRRVLFDDESFDEPAAITFDKFRRWANEVDRNRQQVESLLDRLKRIFD
jgi:penicillin-binding protein 1B